MTAGFGDTDAAWLPELVAALGPTADVRWHESLDRVVTMRFGPDSRPGRTVGSAISRDAGVATRVWSGRRREERHVALPDPAGRWAEVPGAPLCRVGRTSGPPRLPASRGLVREGWADPPDVVSVVAAAAGAVTEVGGSARTTVTVRARDDTVAVANSAGAHIVSVGTWLSLDVEVAAGGRTAATGRLLEPSDDPAAVVAALVAPLAGEATARLDPTAAGRTAVVVDPEFAGLLAHEMVGHALEGDTGGESPAWAEPGRPVANADVTIRDDPTIYCPYGSVWDHEASVSVPVDLVLDGVVGGRLHSISSAERTAEPSSGHARAVSWRHPPIPRMSTTFFAPGRAGAEELMAQVEDGLFLYGARGGDGSGPGFWACSRGSARIRAGKPGPRGGPVLLYGDAARLLASIQGVGGDWTLFGGGEGGCGKLGQFPFPVASGGASLLLVSVPVAPLRGRRR
ncbi:MAG: metallopeptidase TldD-related protein [Acidimicrobiia bacterium]